MISSFNKPSVLGALVVSLSILAISAIELYALSRGVNGTGLGLATAGIGGIVGSYVRGLLYKKNRGVL
jgi:hypothetical protein